MNEITRITIDLEADDAARLQRAVDEGAYASLSEAVADALQLLDIERAYDDTELRRLWDEGIASGDAGAFDVSDVMAEVDKRLAASKGE